MKYQNFTQWCAEATAGIRFPPDREAVSAELRAHLDDHYDDLLAHGLPEEEARKQALAAMGDAKVIAPQLAAIHRPFWGYFLRATRAVLVLTLCAVLLCGILRIWNTKYDGPDYYHALDPYQSTSAEQDYATMSRLFYTEPQQSVQSDGYTLTLTRAAVWHIDYADVEYALRDCDTLYFQIEVFNPRPWAEHTDIVGWFWAVDSLGNTYDSDYLGIHNYAPYISGNRYHTAPLTYTHDMWISDYRSQDAEWIEFHYDRSGRDIMFRIDLTGGDAE
ncbi:MAG: hypothetical protein IJX69_04745 [Oscillospiraceae bacterium]|nr:hypothetical protein [Oscillospiraceae bacterium]